MKEQWKLKLKQKKEMKALRKEYEKMDYKSAIKYLESSIEYGINPSLERISKLAERLENPNLAYKSIHITGTNGKTSVAIIAASILYSLGFKTGLYTSPHLKNVNERIIVKNEKIENKKLANLISRIIPEVEKVNQISDDPLTYFEILTALAFLYFKEEEIDCAVFEVGMGGRWDATNLVNCKVAIVTNIELDHTDILGESLSAIAEEKLGIIKHGSCVITGEKKPEMVEIIKKKCIEKKADLKILGTDFKTFSIDENRIRLKGICSVYNDLSISLLGHHQITNMAIAIAACEAFIGEALPERVLRKVLKNISNPGRLEVMLKRPLVVLDGAHNPHGALALANALKEFKYKKLILVLSILKDKDVENILSILVPLSDFTFITQNKNTRSLSSRELMRKVEKFTRDFREEKKITSAISAAIGLAAQNDLVLVTGSLYTVGEARDYLRKRSLGSRLEN